MKIWQGKRHFVLGSGVGMSVEYCWVPSGFRFFFFDSGLLRGQDK